MAVYNGSRLYVLRPRFLIHYLKNHRAQPDMSRGMIEDILAEYGLALIGPPRLPAGGSGRNQSIVAPTSRGRKLLKRYEPTVPEPAITLEHSVLTYLAKMDFPSARLSATLNNATWVSRDERHYALFDMVEGGFQYHRYIMLPARSRKLISVAMAALAALHDRLRGFVPEGYNDNGFKSQTGDRGRDLEWFINRLADCVRARPQLSAAQEHQTDALRRRAKTLEASLIQLETQLKNADLPRWIIHGDYGPYNLIFRQHAPAVVLDFEIAHLDWRVTEVVDALLRFCGYRHPALRLSEAQSALAVYQAYMPLTQDELQLMPAVWNYLHIRRCIQFWDQYCRTQADLKLSAAGRHAALVDWMTAHREAFASALGIKAIAI